MEYDAINSFLKRPLADGSRYNRYFVESSCKPTFLNYGDTRFTVSKMKQWAIKNREQTKSLAINEFSGMSLADTVTAIYDFLYGHIQYELDRTDQNIKSPACAWASREQGTDCKSYSVFASTILQNLGISHYFRRVKQPGINPEKWTHVYVIVPIDQKSGKLNRGHLVLDATVHDNKEVSYLKKNDVYMEKVSLPHYGLQSPGLSGCSCKKKITLPSTAPKPVVRTPSRTYTSLVEAPIERQTALRAPASFEESKFQEALIKYKLFLKDLNLKGVPASVTKNAMKRLQAHINSGKQPTLRDLLVPETGMGAITAPLLTNTNQLPSSSTYFNGSRSSRTSGGSGALSTVSTVLTAVNPVVGTATGLLTNLVPKDLFDKTFGAVFANGFNFKCWGATWNPTKAEKVFNEEAAAIKAKLETVLRTPIDRLESEINAFWVWFYGVRSTERDWLATSAKDCTKDGLKILIGSLDGLAAQGKSIISQSLEGAGHKIQSTTAIKKTYPPESHTGRHALTMDVPQYRVTIGSGSQTIATTSRGGRSNTAVRRVNVSQQTTAQRTGTTNLSNTYVDQNGQVRTTPDNINNTQNLPNNKLQQAGFGGATAIVLASIVAGTFLLSKKGNNQKSKV